MTKFTLVSTVFNEMEGLKRTIDDIERQTLRPSQIVITDAGSTDGTIKALYDWATNSELNIKILVLNGCNIAEGRNYAIENSDYELIVSTDFGCTFHPDWLKTIVNLFDDPSVEVAATGFGVRHETINTSDARAYYVLVNGYKVDFDINYLPSSRSIAYYKHVWEKAGRYPEWLTLAADDLMFALRLKQMNAVKKVSAEKLVFWSRFANGKQYVKEAFRYGLGDGEAELNRRNFKSNFIELILRYIFGASIGLGILAVLLGYPIKLLGVAAILISGAGLRSYIRVIKNYFSIADKKISIAELIKSFLLLEQTRIAYIKGYILGYYKKTGFKRAAAKAISNLNK